LLVEQAHSDGAILIVVSHDTRLCTLFDRTIHLDSGQLRHP
jgi:ABC-type lipoprotein export system ATPase subunit